MARLTRLTAADLPHHVMQIGHNRQPVFIDDIDRQNWCAHLRESSLTAGVEIHAYVLLDNHAHLLATPRACAQALSLMMQALGRRYVAGFNRRHGRSGTLWEGRFRAALVDPEKALLPCMRYIDTHASRSHQGDDATPYPWCSLAHHLGHRRDPLITDHAVYWALGNTPFEREAAYRSFIDQGVTDVEAQAIYQATRRGWPLGDPTYQRRLRMELGRPVRPKPRGRPSKKALS